MIKLLEEDANDLKNAARSIIEVLRKAGRSACLEQIESCAKAAIAHPHDPDGLYND